MLLLVTTNRSCFYWFCCWAQGKEGVPSLSRLIDVGRSEVGIVLCYEGSICDVNAFRPVTTIRLLFREETEAEESLQEGSMRSEVKIS